jgi:hypothetical protein
VPGAKASVDCVTGGAAGAEATGRATATVGVSGLARMREMGGRNVRLVVSAPSVRFGRGFFSSINDTVSITGFGAGLGVSNAFGGSSECARVLGAGVEAERGAFAGASSLTLFASLRFGSGAALTGAAALTGLRAVADLRAAVLIVVFVGICIPGKFKDSVMAWGQTIYCAAGLS